MTFSETPTIAEKLINPTMLAITQRDISLTFILLVLAVNSPRMRLTKPSSVL
jgi:hypothetical protein